MACTQNIGNFSLLDVLEIVFDRLELLRIEIQVNIASNILKRL